PGQAREFLARCIVVCDETDDDETRRTATVMWGMTLLDEGDPDRAEELLRSSLAPTSADQDLRMVAHVLLGLAAVACSRGGMSKAIEFLVPAVLLEESLGFRFEEDEQRRVHAVLDSARAVMSSEEFDAAGERARERTIDEIL